MTYAEESMCVEMYDGYGVVARESALAVDALRHALDGAIFDNVPVLVREALHRLERIHAVAAAERERWA